ncbi:MAG TPA: RNA pseudouridine synthase [Burkholderiaceae bacterium]|nr:RNA pseudouridine synthase [Burkholderiaceae bacterium]
MTPRPPSSARTPARAPAPTPARAPHDAAAAPSVGRKPPRPPVRPVRSNVAPSPAVPTDEGVRLSKRVMAEIGCSRAEAERLIEEGRVQVNGKVVREIPRRVHAHQRVEADTTLPTALRVPVTLLLHKPAQVALADLGTLLLDEQRWPQDRSGLVVTPRQQSQLRDITPLEDAASGLMVWTQSPAVVRKLVDEGSLIEHELMADVRGSVSPEQLQLINRAQPQADNPHAPVRVQASIGHQHGDVTRLRLAVKGYWPGLALAVCDAAGLTLVGLKRIRIGRLSLKDLPEGQWRGLMGYERF